MPNSDPTPPFSPRLAFGLMGSFLLLLPFALLLPGSPASLKADEAAYYMMASSLAFDGDTRLEVSDLERLFDEFPDRRTRNLVVMSSDEWRTIHYGKPHIYSLAAAPLVRFFGYRGLVVLNLLLFLGCIGFVYRFLQREETAHRAFLFALLFFFLGTTWIYAFWIQPEILSMFCVAGALALGLRRPTATGAANLPGIGPTLLSGALLAIGVFNKPYLAPLGLVFLVGAWRAGRLASRDRPLRWFGTWLAGATVAMALAAGSAWLLTGSPTSYVGVARDSVPFVCSPDEVTPPAEAVAARQAREQIERVQSAGDTPAERPQADPATPVAKKSWGWFFRIPPVTFGENLENLTYFFVGRHTGLLIYFPFVGVAILLFLFDGLRSRRRGTVDPLRWERWTLLATSLGIGVFLLIFISWNWQGGGGFVGNRYFVIVVPAFAFLVRRVRPAGLLTLGAGTAGLFLGPLLMSPFGLSVPEPTLQAHARGAPFRLLPIEYTLRNVPGMISERVGGLRMRARADRWRPRGSSFWTYGGVSTEIAILSVDQLEAQAFLVRSLARRPGRVALAFAGAQHDVVLEPGEQSLITLDPQRHTVRHNPNHEPFFVYTLEVETEAGQPMTWHRGMPTNPCPNFARDDVYTESFHAGAEIVPLGPVERLRAEVFDLDWLEVGETEWTAGQRSTLPVLLRNTSSATWPAGGGAATVSPSYHWRTLDGSIVVYDGRRTQLPHDVPPGEVVELELDVEAPETPGEYLLELDAVFEYVGWFSERGARTVTLEVRIEPPAGDPSADSDATP